MHFTAVWIIKVTSGGAVARRLVDILYFYIIYIYNHFIKSMGLGILFFRRILNSLLCINIHYTFAHTIDEKSAFSSFNFLYLVRVRWI